MAPDPVADLGGILVAASVETAVLVAAADESRRGFLTSEFWVGAAVLLLWALGLLWVGTRRTRVPGETQPGAAPDRRGA